MKPHLVSLFQALGDNTRLRLLNLLAGGELCVCYLVEILGEDREMQRDRAQLERACCAVRLPAALQNAPKPELRTRAS